MTMTTQIFKRALRDSLTRRHAALYDRLTDDDRKRLKQAADFYGRVLAAHGHRALIIVHEWKQHYIVLRHHHRAQLIDALLMDGGPLSADDIRARSHQQALDDIAPQLTDNPYRTLILECIRMDGI